MFGGHKAGSSSIKKSQGVLRGTPSGYGGHFRAVQGFKYIGTKL
jgi:hypothetical protein